MARTRGELIAEFVLAMKHGLGLNKILGTIHAYPTWVEANKYVAITGSGRRAPQKLLHWVRRFHDWERADAAPSSSPSSTKLARLPELLAAPAAERTRWS